MTPRRAPNWLGSIVGRLMSRSQRPTMDSNTLASVGNNEIGRRSLSIDLGGLSLGIGITSADFHACGNVRYTRDWLNIAQTGSANEGASSLRSQFGIESGWEALWTFMPFRASATCQGSITYWLQSSSLRSWHKSGRRGCKSAAMLPEKSSWPVGACNV